MQRHNMNKRREKMRQARSSHWRVQLAIIFVVSSAAWYTPWLILNADYEHPLLSVPFIVAFLYLVVQVHVSAFNNWQWMPSPTVEVPRGAEPPVAVIVPTCGEPPDMVRRTLVSVLKQDWPNDAVVIVVSDDAASHDMESMTFSLVDTYPTATIRYHRPPIRGSSDRRGDAKAGNLNSALDLLGKEYPDIQYIETRDADDEVGDPLFLRRTLGPLQADAGAAFVQTIKEARVSPGDPFNNQEHLFYRGVMRGRHAANAVFPCGSGVVWQRRALDNIGGFPFWNLVEDLQSGMEALKRGWRGIFVSIVGAKAQHAPEDLGNLYKQRGTWALDTMRLLIWRPMEGMKLRQKLQFLDMAMFYCQGFSMSILYIMSTIYVVLGTEPVKATPYEYFIHFSPYVLSIELFIWAMAKESGTKNLFAIRRMWLGLMFVSMKAVLKAIAYGPHRKPVYRVTRKNDVHQWYWRATLPHILVSSILIAACLYATVVRGVHSILRPDIIYWILITVVFLGSFVPLGWHGINVRQAIRSLFRLSSQQELETLAPATEPTDRIATER